MIDLDDIQSLIVRPSRAQSLQIHFVRFMSRAGMRLFLREAASVVTTATVAARQASDSPAPATVTVGVSAAGLELAGLEPRARAALPEAFLSGMQSRALQLGDIGDSDPTRWHPPFEVGPRPNPNVPVHAVVLVHRSPDSDFPDAVKTMLQAGERVDETAPGNSVSWDGQTLGGYERFGFRDTVTDPVIEGSGKPMTPGNGIWDAEAQRWRPVKAGEAVMGYVDESGSIAGHADAAHVERNGSYLVMRKLEQDVKGFWGQCTALANELGIPEPEPEPFTPIVDTVPAVTAPVASEDPDWDLATHARTTAAGVIAARMVGRTWDGKVLGQPGADANDFLYRDPKSSLGIDVSPSAHIRRANPRDGIAKAEDLVRRHQLFRRGIPYFDEATFAGSARVERPARGLLFLAFCADISRQFEFVQSRWLQDGSRFGLGRERDPLTGTRHAQPQAPWDAAEPAADYPVLDGLNPPAVVEPDPQGSIDHDGQRCRRDLRTFVATRGGEYFLVPGKAALLLLGDPKRAAG